MTLPSISKLSRDKQAAVHLLSNSSKETASEDGDYEMWNNIDAVPLQAQTRCRHMVKCIIGVLAFSNLVTLILLWTRTQVVPSGSIAESIFPNGRPGHHFRSLR